MRRNRYRALGVLALLTAVLPPTAAAVRASAGDAGGAWVPQGTAVRGTASSADAPPLTPGTSYRDSLGTGQTKYYAVTLDATSAAYLSVFAVPRPGSTVGFMDGAGLKLVATDGTLCDTYDARFGADNAAYPIGGYVARTISQYGQCQQGGTYLLSVQRNSGSGTSPAAWPLEIRYMSEPGLKAGASTGTPQSVQSGSPQDAGTVPRTVSGGSSIDNAPALAGAGAYKDHLMPGQSRFYRVPLDWGQQLSATGDFANAATTQAGGFTAGGVRLDVYNTARGLVGGNDAVYSGQEASASVATARVAYANRLSSDATVKASPFAGWYYVQLALHPDVAKYTSGGVDVVLRLDVTGTVTAAPAYSGNAAKAGFGVTDTDRAAAEAGIVPGARPNTALRAVGFGALGLGTTLVMALAAWFVLARRHPVDAAQRRPYGRPPTW